MSAEVEVHIDKIDTVDASAILSRLNTQELKESKYCVFDLDSTLFDVSYRMKECFKLFLATYPQFKEWAVLLEYWTPASHQYKNKNLFNSLISLSRISPNQNKVLDLIKHYTPFWKDKAFANELIKLDTPYTGAARFVQKIESLNYRIVYLTGRNKKNMLDGTIKSLQKHSFPMNDNTQLFLKPGEQFKFADNAFKKDVLIGLEKDAGVAFFIDNEIINLKAARQTTNNKCLLTLFRSIHSSPKTAESLAHFKKYTSIESFEGV